MVYIEKLPKLLIEDIRNGRCLPIIGAGFSRNAITRTEQGRLPDWNGLASRLKAESSYESTSDVKDSHICNPIEVISAFCQKFGRIKLIEILHEIFWNEGVKPGKVHHSFSKIPFEVVCTTNYDFLLEEAYKSASRPCKPLLNEADLCMAQPKGYVSLLKIHGDLHHPDRLILTEEDYDQFIRGNPLICTFLANQLMTKTPLFLGYSVEDADFRQVWQIVKSRLGLLFRKGYRLSLKDNDYVKESFQRRGITVINLDGKSYEDAYCGLFEELQQLLLSDASVNLANLNSELASALKESDSRVVVFAIPTSLLAFYKENIFPLVVEAGFVPISFQELTTALGSFNANVSTLVEKSAAIVIDDAAEDRFVLFGLALKKLIDRSVLTIKVEGKDLHDLPGTAYIVRPENVYGTKDEEVAHFIQGLFRWFLERKIEQEQTHQPSQQPGTMSPAESLSQFLECWNTIVAQLIKRFGNLPVRTLFKTAFENKIISQKDLNLLLDYIQTRNSLVHGSMQSDPSFLAEPIRFLESVAAKIQKKV